MCVCGYGCVWPHSSHVCSARIYSIRSSMRRLPQPLLLPLLLLLLLPFVYFLFRTIKRIAIKILYTVCVVSTKRVVVVALCENVCYVLHVFVMRACHSFSFLLRFFFFAIMERARAREREHASFVDQSFNEHEDEPEPIQIH